MGQANRLHDCTQPLDCLNDCRGKGKCVRGVCVCDKVRRALLPQSKRAAAASLATSALLLQLSLSGPACDPVLFRDSGDSTALRLGTRVGVPRSSILAARASW